MRLYVLRLNMIFSYLPQECPVPDGGWGWMVCGASFMVNFILDGTMFSFGILLLALLEDLQETKAVTSWVGSAQLGMSMMMGQCQPGLSGQPRPLFSPALVGVCVCVCVSARPFWSTKALI